MKIQVTIGAGTGRGAEVVEAAGSYDALLARLQEPEVAARLKCLPYAHLVVMAGPWDPLPGAVCKITSGEALRAA